MARPPTLDAPRRGSLELVQSVPPPITRRRSTIGPEYAAVALRLFKRMEWVGAEKAYRTRREAVYQATRLVRFLREIEPASAFNKRTWEAGGRWHWAIRRAS